MLQRLTSLSLLTACVCFTSCATPRTSPGVMDLTGDGNAESVVQLQHAQDRDAALLRRKKSEVCAKAVELANRNHQGIEQLYKAGRRGVIEMLRSEEGVIRAKIQWVDAQLEPAQANVLSATEATVIETEQGMLAHKPVPVSKLLDQKVDLHRALLEQRQQGHKRVQVLSEAGSASAEEVRRAAQQMYEAEIDWLNARMERRKMKSVDGR